MISIECSRGAIRLYNRIEKDANPASEVDRLVLLVTMMGWAGETVDLIQKAHKRGGLKEELLSSESPFRHVWTSVVAESQVLGKLLTIRNKCFAHWDEAVAQTCLRRLVKDDHLPPIVEMWGAGEHLATRFPWAFDAIAGTIIRPDQDIAEWRETISSIGKLVGNIQGLASELILGLLRSMGLEIKPE
jgi:hypothetical protein